MQSNVYFVIGVGTAVWFPPFVLAEARQKASPIQTDKRARWGIALQFLAYTCLLQGRFWDYSPEEWRIGVAAILFAVASLLSWTATRALGEHFRVDAAVSATQELIRSGPYRVLRHPIYTSMGCVLIAMGLLLSSTIALLASIVLFTAGTEIRIRIEERLLAERFRKEFLDYQSGVAKWIPLLK